MRCGLPVFAFTNKRRTLLKLLYFEGSGSSGARSRGRSADVKDGKLRLSATALGFLLDGIDMRDGVSVVQATV